MSAERFACTLANGLTVHIEWPVDKICDIMRKAIHEMQQSTGQSDASPAIQGAKLGLIDYGPHAKPQDRRAGPLEQHLFMIDAVIGKLPQIKVEKHLAKHCWEVAVSAARSAGSSILAVAISIIERWRTGKELSHEEKMQLIQAHLAANFALKEAYHFVCHELSQIYESSSPAAQAFSQERLAYNLLADLSTCFCMTACSSTVALSRFATHASLVCQCNKFLVSTIPCCGQVRTCPRMDCGDVSGSSVEALWHSQLSRHA